MKVFPIIDVSNKNNLIPKEEKKTVIPLKNFSDYFLENVAMTGPIPNGQLQITSACDAKCFYCSNDQNDFETARTKFRDINEIEKILWAMPHEFGGGFVLNESLPGRISEGEATVHPKFIEIVELIRRKYHHNEISITTSGSRLTPELLEKISRYRPFKVTLSIPSVNEKYWNEIYKLKPINYQNAMNSISIMKRLGINIGVHMVPMPSYVGYDDIENTIKFIAQNGLKHIIVFAPGYTRYTDVNQIEKMKYDKQELSDFLENMSYKYNIYVDWLLDPKNVLNINMNLINDTILKFYYQNIKRSYWLTSVSCYDRFKNLIKSLVRNIPHEVVVVPVENKSYGGNIEVSGLWMISDLEDKINELNLKDEHIIFPRNFIDNYGFDLNGNNIVDFLNRCKNYIYLM